MGGKKKQHFSSQHQRSAKAKSNTKTKTFTTETRRKVKLPLSTARWTGETLNEQEQVKKRARLGPQSWRRPMKADGGFRKHKAGVKRQITEGEPGRQGLPEAATQAEAGGHAPSCQWVSRTRTSCGHADEASTFMFLPTGRWREARTLMLIAARRRPNAIQVGCMRIQKAVI